MDTPYIYIGSADIDYIYRILDIPKRSTNVAVQPSTLHSRKRITYTYYENVAEVLATTNSNPTWVYPTVYRVRIYPGMVPPSSDDIQYMDIHNMYKVCNMDSMDYKVLNNATTWSTYSPVTMINHFSDVLASRYVSDHK